MEVVNQLNYTRRKEILILLSLKRFKIFQELKNETSISTGSLHHHLKELCKDNLVRNDADSWPHRYSQTPFLARLIDMTTAAVDDRHVVSNPHQRQLIADILRKT